jgi:hypothetical protein
MSYMDEPGMNAFWDQIDNVFARLSEAVGSARLDNGTTLVLLAVNGNTLQSINLSDGLAADSEAAGKFEFVNGILIIKAVDDTPLKQIDFDARYARSLSYDSSTKVLSLKNGNGVTIPNSSVTLS